MENKKKITVDIAGTSLTLLTDEDEDFVRETSAVLGERVSKLMGTNMHISAIDASLLCAVDYLGDKLKAEKKIRTLEAQLSLCEVSLKSAREELEKTKAELKEALSHPETGTGEFEAADDIVTSAPEDRVRALEQYLDSRKSVGSLRTHEERINYIKSLLRDGNE